MKIYLVGGAVRDDLLGLPVKDRDWVVVGATAEELQQQGFQQVGRDFPVFLHPKTHEEYALARTERKKGKGYTGFEVHAAPDVTLEEDLLRRDLTINAMAMDENHQLIDPFGGAQDLKNGILRHVSDAFAEDPVRILRIARFAARYDFQVASETMMLMKNMVQQGETDALVAERVWQEISTGLMEKNPARMLMVLKECGALAVILPEIDALFGVPQREDYHPEIDTGKHILLALQKAAEHDFSLPERYAVLCHDVGKALTPQEILPRHRNHEQRGVELVRQINRRLRVPKACAQLASIVVAYHGIFHQIQQLRASTIVDILHRTDAFRRSERFLSAVKTGIADAQGRLGFESQEYPQYACWQQCLQACQRLDIKQMAQETDAFRLPETIRNARIQLIKQIKQTWSD